MRYSLIKENPGGSTVYEVWDGDLKMGTFSYFISEAGRFYIKEIRLSAGSRAEEVFHAVIQFLEYKAAVSADGPVYVRVDEKNHFQIRHYLEQGFYSIDTEEKTDASGRESRIIVMRNR